VSGSADTTVRVWDTSSGGEVILPLRGLNEWVKRAQYSADESHIIATSEEDKIVCSWDATSGALVSETTNAFSDLFHDSWIVKGWIAGMNVDGIVCKLPPMISMNMVTRYAVSKTSIAVGMRNGQLIIVRFPPTILTGQEYRPFVAHFTEDGGYTLFQVAWSYFLAFFIFCISGGFIREKYFSGVERRIKNRFEDQNKFLQLHQTNQDALYSTMVRDIPEVITVI